MLLEEVNQLLEPGYLPMETGYCRLKNGQAFAASLVRMPGCRAEMLDWWFGSFLRDTETYKQWDPKAHLRFEWDDKWSPGHYIGASHYGEEYLAGEVCGEGFLPNGTPDGRVIHLARDTESGAEVRSRFWIYSGDEKIAKGHMEHCLSEMGYMADLLPSVYPK